MSRRYLVSVGTSLIGQCNDHGDFQIASRESGWEYAGEHCQYWIDCLKTYAEELCAGGEDDACNASAELSSLFKGNPVDHPAAGDSILLIHTNTRSGLACASALQHIIQNRKIEVRLACVEGLSEAGGKDFYSRGLPNLIDLLYREITDARRESVAPVLVPTGGYKALIPYFVLMGILLDLPCRYIYEESDEVIDLPMLPLHADLGIWTSLETLLKIFEGKSLSDASSSRLYQHCARQLKTLLYPDFEDRLRSSGLVKLLQRQVENDRRRSELQFRTQHSPLLFYLEDEYWQEVLKGLFLRMAAIGPNIWKGDRVPEMADHALLHHADLFHLAERVLLPIFYFYEQEKSEPFLAPEELFVLLGSLLLHDCGHVVGQITLNGGGRHDLLPTEIRDYHHILGYLRLREPDRHGGTGRWIHNALTNAQRRVGDIPWEPDDLSEALHAIATVGLYHRKAMKLKQTEPGQGYPFRFIRGSEMETVPCLADFVANKALRIRDKTLDPIRIPLIVSLLRIIDSLDEQGARTGGKETVLFHLAQLQTEAREEEERAKGLRGALEAVEGAVASLCKTACNKVSQLDQLIEDLFRKYEGRESKGKSSETALPPDAPKGFWESFNEVYAEGDAMRQLALVYSSAAIRAKFKRFQAEPFEEKLEIDHISINHEIGDGFVTIMIIPQIAGDVGDEEKAERNRDKLLKSMKGEYLICERIENEDLQVVRCILENAGVRLVYGALPTTVDGGQDGNLECDGAL